MPNIQLHSCLILITAKIEPTEKNTHKKKRQQISSLIKKTSFKQFQCYNEWIRKTLGGKSTDDDAYIENKNKIY